jgi:tripartite-type tricarboxylate transporter receptor subunit TctC
MNHRSKWFCLLSGMLLIALGFVSPSAAQRAEDASAYPSSPIRIIVPFPPGGPNDILARLIADELSAKWKASVVVDNRPGGGTIIGTQAAARSPADGYNLLMVSLSTATNISLKKSLPFDTLKDFTPIIRLAESPNVLVTNLDAPVKTVADLISWAKASPGAITYGTGGVGTATDLAGHLLCVSTGAKMVGAPYKGDAPAIVDLLGGRITWMFGTILPIMPQIEAGKVRPIAISGSRRSDVLPNVPTVAETVPGFDATSWYGIFAPAGTSPAIVTKLNGAIDEILRSEKVSQYLKKQGTTPVGGSAETFGTFFRAEVEKWRKVITTAGIEPQ